MSSEYYINDKMAFNDALCLAMKRRMGLFRWRGNDFYTAEIIGLCDQHLRDLPVPVGVDMAKPGTDHTAYFAMKRNAVADAFEAANSAGRTAPTGRMQSEKPVDVMKVERALNGGWTVETLSSEPYRAGLPIGAFTTTADMLRALADLLERDDEKRKEATLWVDYSPPTASRTASKP